jgi:hypothetical protein
MLHPAIAHQRLHNQHIATASFEKPAEVVQWMGAVQAQEYLGALWAVGLRMRQASAADVEQAMADGVIIRTHPMRDTWHFVAAEDIHWLLTLMAPGRIARNAPWYRRLELDEATIASSHAAFRKTLQGGKSLTRRELAAALEQAGISTRELRLTFLLARAEIEGVICSGPRRGKQFTYRLLDELVPVYKTLQRDEAQAELAHRYFTSHGPATLQDFVWWSGLKVAEARAGLETVKSHFTHEVIGGQTYWFSPSTPPAQGAAEMAYLLPSYDEYTVSYKDRSAIFDGPQNQLDRETTILNPTIVIDSRVVGLWAREMQKDTVVITPKLFASLNQAEKDAIAAPADRYAAFFGKQSASIFFQGDGL